MFDLAHRLSVFKAAFQDLFSGEIFNDLTLVASNFSWVYLLSVTCCLVPFGIAIGWYKRFAMICDPFVNAMNATPRIALLPLVIIWLGIGNYLKVVSFSLCSLPLVDQHS